MPSPITRNTLFYGDNLPILREHIPTESVDLIYLDPPFNSNRSYNVLFKNESGQGADAQIQAFDDTWHWGTQAEETYDELINGQNDSVSSMISAMRQFIGTNQMMAYLVMMAIRLIELHRVLKQTGSIFLHCDPTASHYLKIVLDTVFGIANYRNEIIWKRTFAHNDPSRCGRVHDTIFFYTKSNSYTWNDVLQKPDPEYVNTFFDQYDEVRKERYARIDLTAPLHGDGGNLLFEWKGMWPAKSRTWATTIDKLDLLDRDGKIHYPKSGMPRLKRYESEYKGTVIQDIWSDINQLHNLAAERRGYPTQKPLALLERIIQASSNPGDLILDPFSGCGTAIMAAQKLNRNWIGIDVTHLAIAMHKNRLKEGFSLEPGKDYDVKGEPTDLAGAQQLARDDRYQFQWWALSLINARPLGGTSDSKVGKKGGDQGIDGVIPFMDDEKKKMKRVIISVKSGSVNPGMVRDLRGVIDRESDAPIGVFITLENPTPEMSKEAVSAGFYTSPLWQKKYPRLQILTIEQLLAGEEVKMPPAYGTFKQAERIKKEGIQPELDFD